MAEQTLIQPIININSDDKSDKARQYLEQARIYHERYLIRKDNGDLQDAITNYIDAVKYDPTIPETYYRLASLMWEQGQISINSAIDQCKTAVSLAPNNMNAHMYTGFFMQLAENYPEAIDELKSAVKSGKFKSARPRLVLSQAFLQKINSGSVSPADYLNFVYYFLSGSVMLAWDRPLLKMMYKRMSDDLSVFTYSTVGHFLEKFKMYDKAEKIYKQAVLGTQHSQLFYDKIGDIALKNDEIDLCADCYRKVLESNPLNREVLMKLAVVLQTYYPDNTTEAIECYERLLEFDVDTAAIYYELGHLYLRREDKINSVSAFKLALERDTENPYYNNSLAFAYSKASLYDDAIEHYQKAITLNPDNEWTSIVCHALGTIYAEEKGNIDAAIATYQAGLILDPSNYELYIALGDTYMAIYDLDNAIKAYCDAILAEPDNYRGYSKAGIALYEKDFVEEALVAYHKSIELNPENALAHNNLGIVYLEGMLDAEEALEYFEEAINLDPSYTLAYFNAGRASQKMGFTNDAANYYQMAIDLNKDTQDLDEEDILERLRSLFDV